MLCTEVLLITTHNISATVSENGPSYIAKEAKFLDTDNKDYDQTEPMHRLI